jgi:DNA-binding response OmpR family regulator
MNKMIKVLLAEDEQALGLIIKESLESQNMSIDLHTNGVSAFKAYNAYPPDILILDIMMPLKDGLSLTKEIRKNDVNIPIILLTARSLTSDVVTGFNAGCNDYIRKPFSMEELIVRIYAMINRTHTIQKNNSPVEIGFYVFCQTKQTLTFQTKIFTLTHRESSILEMLFHRKNEVVNRIEILQKLWHNDDFFAGRSLDVFITKLRKRLSMDESIKIINIRGIGYKLVF